LPELPERLALADPAAAVNALRHCRRDAFGRDEQRRQHGGRLLGPIPQTGARGGRQAGTAGQPVDGRAIDGLRRDHRSGIVI
jgi:hypothetical protein